MQDTKLTVRVPRDVLEDAKGYAQRNRTTLTRLVSEYLRRLADEKGPLADAPTVRRLAWGPFFRCEYGRLPGIPGREVWRPPPAC